MAAVNPIETVVLPEDLCDADMKMRDMTGHRQLSGCRVKA